MTMWCPESDRLTRPFFLSLAGEIRRAIEEGRLVPGARLPPHRALAHALGLSVQTVSRAYNLLERDGILTGRVGSGTYVGAGRPDPGYPFIESSFGSGLIDLSILKQVLTPWHDARMRETLADVAGSAPESAFFSFRPGTALAPYLACAQRWLAVCGVTAHADQIQLTAGATPAMSVAIQTAVPPGGTMATEAIGHHMLVHLCKYLGRRLVGIAGDDDGMLPDAFEAACRAEPVAALFVTPSCANPQGIAVTTQRRRALLDVAARYRVRVIENDAWGPLVADRPPPFAAMAPDRVFYITSFTKIMLPGLRAGLLVAPPGLHTDAAKRNLASNWSAVPLVFEVVKRWIEDGTADEMVVRQRKALEARHAIAMTELAGLPFRANRHGLHLWLDLVPPWTSEPFILQLRQQGVAVAPASAFVTEPGQAPNSVRVSLGPAPEPDLRRALAILRALYDEEPAPAMFGL
ncbi:MAG: PLP-dependent aminotransferase family protein [Alphaproteobacteria bacterium]